MHLGLLPVHVYKRYSSMGTANIVEESESSTLYQQWWVPFKKGTLEGTAVVPLTEVLGTKSLSVNYPFLPNNLAKGSDTWSQQLALWHQTCLTWIHETNHGDLSFTLSQMYCLCDYSPCDQVKKKLWSNTKSGGLSPWLVPRCRHYRVLIAVTSPLGQSLCLALGRTTLQKVPPAIALGCTDF